MSHPLPLTEKALRVAVTAHASQVRKTDNSPYIVHPVMCALMLTKHGFSETIVSASLVHDVLEDTAFTREQLTQELGEEVVRIVEGVSEDKVLPWRERKELYAKTIEQGDEAIRAVSLADKIHNLESMLRGYEAQGEELWTYFTKGKEEQVWFFSRMGEVFASWEHPLVTTYATLLQNFVNLVSTSK